MPRLSAADIATIPTFDPNAQIITPLPPMWFQRGPTCGLYALDAAFKSRGITATPPPRADGKPTGHGMTKSLRHLAKNSPGGLSKIGELFSAEAALNLAQRYYAARNSSDSPLPMISGRRSRPRFRASNSRAP